MEFYVKPAGGFTARMMKLAGTGKRIPVSIDGPYGDSLTAQKLGEKDTVVLIAGGSGAGYLLPLLETLVRKSERGGNDVKVVIAVRHKQSVDWLLNAMEGILSLQKESSAKISVELQITDDPPLPTPERAIPNSASSSADVIQPTPRPSDPEKKATSTETSAYPASSQKGLAVIEGRGRPDLKALIKASAAGGRSVGIAACGPASMMLDVRNACAEAQRGIIAGE
ncbi:Ferric reductase transmembrane component, partial [Lachnellula willkommii]